MNHTTVVSTVADTGIGDGGDRSTAFSSAVAVVVGVYDVRTTVLMGKGKIRNRQRQIQSRPPPPHPRLPLR